MKGFLAFFLCLAVASGFVLKVEEDELQWKAWKDFHSKSYLSQSEEAVRRAIWKDNLRVRYDMNYHSRRKSVKTFLKFTYLTFSYFITTH